MEAAHRTGQVEPCHCALPSSRSKLQISRPPLRSCEALGPSQARKRLLPAGIALLLATSSAIITYRHVTAFPVETVRLAIVPFSAAPDCRFGIRNFAS